MPGHCKRHGMICLGRFVWRKRKRLLHKLFCTTLTGNRGRFFMIAQDLEIRNREFDFFCGAGVLSWAHDWFCLGKAMGTGKEAVAVALEIYRNVFLAIMRYAAPALACWLPLPEHL